MNDNSCRRLFSGTIAWMAVGILALHGCNSESAPLWQLVDPGGGGAAPAIYRVPESAHLVVGSDVGGVRYSDDAGGRFRVINEGLDFSTTASDNFQDMLGYRRRAAQHLVGSTTAGLLFWRRITDSGLDPAWTKFFDAGKVPGNGASTVGALALDPTTTFLYAGTGNVNNLAHNRLTELNPRVSGHVYVFALGDADADPGPPQPAATLALADLCPDLQQGPYLHIGDLASASIGGTEYLFVGTNAGLYILREPRSANVSCESRLIPGRNNHVLAVKPAAGDAADLVVLLNEGSLSALSGESSLEDRGPRKIARSTGGLFHTDNVIDAEPGWRDITPKQARGNGVGKLERGGQRPGELVLSGDGRSRLGVLFTSDFESGQWRVVLNNNSFAGKSDTLQFDGWRRYRTPLRGVHEIAIDDGANGIDTLYVAGFQGMLFAGERRGDRFFFRQIFTLSDGRPGAPRFRNRGLPLMNPWRAFVDPQQPETVLFLYRDNMFFVGDEHGDVFRRPWEKFGWGTDVEFAPQDRRAFMSYSIGNRLDENRRTQAERGGILVGRDNASDWQEIDRPLPVAGPVESLAFYQGKLCANVYRKDVFCSVLDEKFSWRRAAGKRLDVVHLFDTGNDAMLYMLVATGNTRQVCRLAGEQPECNDIPVSPRDFRRMWVDDDRLWLAARGERTFTARLDAELRWESVAAAIVDLRSMSVEGERIALIASGAEGLYASRQPQDPDSWCRVSHDGLDGNRNVTSITNPAGGEYVYLSLDGVGFYRASLAELAANLAETCPAGDAVVARKSVRYGAGGSNGPLGQVSSTR